MCPPIRSDDETLDPQQAGRCGGADAWRRFPRGRAAMAAAGPSTNASRPEKPRRSSPFPAAHRRRRRAAALRDDPCGEAYPAKIVLHHKSLTFVLLCLATFYSGCTVMLGGRLADANDSALLAALEAASSDGSTEAPSRARRESSLKQKRSLRAIWERLGSVAKGKACRCVDCDEDELCGGLWRAERFPPLEAAGGASPPDSKDRRFHIVVSHCREDIDWIEYYTAGYRAASVHVISKCGEAPSYLPPGATREVLDNVGRCDHTYAHYISQVLDAKLDLELDDENSIVVFLKDNHNLHQGQVRFVNFESLANLASSSNGFGCAIATKKHNRYLSAYHVWDRLSSFRLSEYQSNSDLETESDSDVAPFASPRFDTFRSFMSAVNPKGPRASDVVPVCYGGIFAASVRNIRKVDPSVWTKAIELLSRGDSVVEGHYMERSWAALLSTPLEEYQADALRACAAELDDDEKWPGRMANGGVSTSCHGERGAEEISEAERKTEGDWDDVEYEWLPDDVKEAFGVLGYDETNWKTAEDDYWTAGGDDDSESDGDDDRQ